MPDMKDALVFVAMARLISQTLDSASFFLANSFAFTTGKDENSFVEELLNSGPVKQLIYIELAPSLHTVCRTRLLSKLEPNLKNPFLR